LEFDAFDTSIAVTLLARAELGQLIQEEHAAVGHGDLARVGPVTAAHQRNNIAWLIRRFPVFPIFGSGRYKVQPVFVEDVAAFAVACAQEGRLGTFDAIGPEVFSFQEFIRLIAAQIKPRVKLLHLPPAMGIALGSLIGLAVRDIILTQNKLRGLMDELLTSDQAPTGATRFSDWIESHHNELGRIYSSELGRHFRWRNAD
jgi:nucleoside-diphosphate-sugar epimerase